MCAPDRGLSDELLPGLPNCIVLGCLLPRIPWYTRPRLRAVSKSWHEALANPGELSFVSREANALSGLVLVHENSEGDNGDPSRKRTTKWMRKAQALSMYEEETQQWRLLPPIQWLKPLRILHDCAIASVDEKIFVMGGRNPATEEISADVYMIDVGGGKWRWERCKPMHFSRAGFHCKAVGGKIYVVGDSSSAYQEQISWADVPESYEASSGEWEILPSVCEGGYGEWSVRYSGLAEEDGKVVAHGWWETQAGYVERFWRRYEAEERRWRRLAPQASRERWRQMSEVGDGAYDLRDGVVMKFEVSTGSWEEIEGARLYERAWWDVIDEGGKVVVAISTCAHSFIVVPAARAKDHTQLLVYATLCKGDNRFLALWRGFIINLSSIPHISWSNLPLPGPLCISSGMASLPSPYKLPSFP